jgi:hypothetical protein
MEGEPDLSRYARGKIYSIRSPQCEKYYIGSTCLDLCKRLYIHRKNYKTFLNGYKCDKITSFEILQYDDHYIELIQDYPCNSKRELEKREGQLQRYYKNDIVNNYYAHLSPEQKKENDKKRYEENKKQILERQKQYNESNKEKVAEQRKQYYEANKEQIAEYKKQYREENKEKVAEQQKRKYEKKKAEKN